LKNAEIFMDQAMHKMYPKKHKVDIKGSFVQPFGIC